MLLTISVQMYGGPVDKQNPRGLQYFDAGTVVDSTMFSPKVRAMMVEKGELIPAVVLDA